MSFHRKPVPLRFTPEKPVEMHFHDQDETWIVMGGKAVAHMGDRDGARTDFEIEEGDVWMVEAGVEHGCDPAAGGVCIFPFFGTRAEGSHEPGHYYW